MSLLDTIKAASLQARKNKDTKKASLLSILISEGQMIGKNNGNRDSTDVEIIAVIKKFIGNARENMNIVKSQLGGNHIERMVEVGNEIEILNSFLPKQFSNEELIAEVDDIIKTINATTVKDLGKVMKTLKEKHEGKYDGTLANALIKQKLLG